MSAALKSAMLPRRVRVIGTVPNKHRDYAATLRSHAALLPITWECDLNDEDVAERLASASLAYLPYQDGASERRAPLKSVLANGIAVITTRGEHTPAVLNDAVMFCKDPYDALSVARSLIDNPSKGSTSPQRKAICATAYVG